MAHYANRHCASRRLRRALWLSAVSWGAVTATTVLAEEGPNSSLYSGRLALLRRQGAPSAPAATGRDDALEALPPPAAAGRGTPAPPPSGWYEIPLPPPKEVKAQDIVTIRVDLGARVASEGELQRRKSAGYDAALKQWVILNGLKSVKPSPQSDGDPRVQGTLSQLFRAQSELETSESIKFDIAAKVASILPNGTVVLEAHREVRNNNEVWLVSLGGICRREDIQPGNVVLSKDIADLKIDKRELGHIRDSYKRGWVVRWLDMFNPF